MNFDPSEINLTRELSYNHPFSNSTLLLSLLYSLLKQQRTPRTRNAFKDEYDYVIVGGGAAGSVLANRLSEEECVTVLLLEYGAHPPIMSELTALFTMGWGKDIDFDYKTAPQRHTGHALNEKRVPYPRGKVLGGSSVINAMLYVRGNHRNFDDWSAMGADGWNYEEVLPYFKKSENNNNPDYVASGFHGKGGELSVSDHTFIEEFQAPVLKAAEQFGYKIGNSNGATQTGFFPEQGTIRDGQRCSAAKAFLVPAENRTNLDILINAHVNKIIFDSGPREPLTATEVEFDHGGQKHIVRARREIIMSAGAINTPQLLMLSGVGPKEQLEKHEIPLVIDLPVGKRLNDHPATSIAYVMNSGMPPATDKLIDEINMRQYIQNRTGPLASTAMVATLAFLKGDQIQPDEDFPDYQLFFFLTDVAIWNVLGVSTNIYDSYFKQYENEPILQCHVSLLQPKSVGNVFLNSKDPYDDPIIDTNYLEHPDDIESMVQGLKTCQKILESDHVKDTLGAVPFKKFPGCEEYEGDDYFRCYLKQFIASTYHPTSTAKMGNPESDDTVVCPRLKVKGIKNLRIVDASVMPKVTSGNTISVVYMIAEKAADMIREDLLRDMQRMPGHCSA